MPCPPPCGRVRKGWLLHRQTQACLRCAWSREPLLLSPYLLEFSDGFLAELFSEFLEFEGCLAGTGGSGFVPFGCLGEVGLKSGHYLIDLCDCLFHTFQFLFDIDISVFRCDVPECPATFDVVGIEVLRFASPEETALPADGTVAKTPELVPYEF